MKNKVRLISFFLLLLLSASLFAVGAEGATDWQSLNVEYGTQKSKLLDERCNEHYVRKQSGDADGAEANTCRIIQEYISDIKDLIYSDRVEGEDLRDEIDLIYNKGMAAGILSWIYYSHTDVHSCSESSVITNTYKYQLSRIDSKNVTDNVESFFVGVAGRRAEVEDCYTVLFQSIYSEKISRLLKRDDSDTVRAIISSAPSSMGSSCRYDSVSSDGEDGGNYKLFFAQTEKSVEEQRNRDSISDELRRVFVKLYPSETFESSELLRFFHNALQTKNTALSMNSLLSDTVAELIDGLISEGEEYKNRYLTTMKNSVIATVAATNSTEPVRIASISVLFDEYTLQLCRATTKDSITAYAASLVERQGYSAQQKQRIDNIVDEYVTLGGFIDRAEAVAQVLSEQTRATVRFDWYELYRRALGRADAYSGDHSGVVERMASQYTSTDNAVKNGSRDLGATTDAKLSADIDKLEELVAEAETIAFLTSHRAILDKTSVTTEDLRALSSAITDADRLSERAKTRISQEISQLGEKYKSAAIAQIRAHVLSDGAEALRRRAADKLVSLVDSLSSRDGAGRFSLISMKRAADSLISKSEQVKALLNHYVSNFLSEGYVHFATDAESLCTESSDSIIFAESGTEITKKNEATVALDRLCALARIFSSAIGYETLDGVSAILGESKLGISSLSDYANIRAYANSQIAKISNIIRLHEIRVSKERISSLADTLIANIADLEFIDSASRADLTARAQKIRADLLAKLDASGNAEIAKTTRAEGEAALTSLSAEVAEKERVCCLASVKNTLDTFCKDKNDYSEENYQKLSELLTRYREEIDKVNTVAEYVRLRDEACGALEKIENRLDEVKRLGEAALASVFETLMKREDCYSSENLARLGEIYSHSVSELKLFVNISDIDKARALVDERSSLMRAVNLDRLYTSDGSLALGEGAVSAPDGYDPASSGYAGSIVSAGGIPSSATLTITQLDGAGAGESIKSAASDKLVYFSDGSVAGKDILKLLKRCAVIASLDISVGTSLASETPYTLSVLLPEGVDVSEIIGVVYIRDDGSVEFFDISMSASVLEFTTEHLSAYYVVGKGKVNLVPWIICLTVIFICELALLAFLLMRRRDRLKDEPIPLAMFISPVSLSVRYVPRNGHLIVTALGVAVVSLASLIAYLAVCEIRLKRLREKKVQQERLREDDEHYISMPAFAKLSSSVDGEYEDVSDTPAREPMALPPIEPMPSVTVEEADVLMSDSEARRLQETNYFDTEIYTGAKRAEINVDTISQMFSAGDVITLNSLKEKKLVPKNVGYIKVLARGRIDKPITVIAQDFSVAAAKMIILTGGSAIPTYASDERNPKAKNS